MTASTHENGRVPIKAGQEKYKIVFLGDAGTGKSAVIKRTIYGAFDESYQATIGVDFFSKDLYLGEKTVRPQLWDASGQERFYTLISSYIRDSQIAVIIFDVTNKRTFNSVEKWIGAVKTERREDAKILLVGNKTDLEPEKREVTVETAEEFAKKHGIKYCEVSAKAGHGINDLFNEDIVGLLSVVSKSENKPQVASPYPDLEVRIVKLTQAYPKNADVIAIAQKLQEGLLDSNPQEFFNREFGEDGNGVLPTHIKKLAWTSRSILNSVVNVVIAVLQKVCAAGHALAYCVGLAEQQTAAYPAFWAFAEKQQAKNLCNDVLDKVGMTLKV